MQPQPLPGFRDFYPAEFALRAHIFDLWRRTCACYGFEEFDGPPLEPLELYTAKSGDEIVGQLYNFTDKGGREVSLRPELTPTVARMVAARAGGMKKPIRWFSIGQMFRYERQQRGRLREFFQLNCDLMGEPGPLADAEIIALAVDLMRAFGLTAGPRWTHAGTTLPAPAPSQIRVRVSDREVLNVLLLNAGVAEDQLSAAYRAVDKIERADWGACSRELATAGANSEVLDAVRRVAEMTGEQDVLFALGQVSQVLRERADAAGNRFKSVLDALESMGVRDWVDVELKIVRGLAYYTGIVFEVFDAGRDFRAIAGGGRYDGLLKQLGGVDLPAVGFAIGDVVLGELLKKAGKAEFGAPHLDVFVAGDKGSQPEVLKAAASLRQGGREPSLRIEYSLRNDQKLAKQLELANSRGARFAVLVKILGDPLGAVRLKDLREHTEVILPSVDAAYDAIVKALKPSSTT